MANLFPEGYEEEVIEAIDLLEDTAIGYRPCPSFDYDTGDFRRDGMNKILSSDGIDSWRVWCINCIQTERYKHRAYSTDFGIELDKVFSATSREEAESILTREITEAILADPYERAKYIETLDIEWIAPDSVIVQLVIHGIDDATIDITANISQGGI